MVPATDPVYSRSMVAGEVSLERVADGWVVRIPSTNGKPPQEFHCTSEAMARKLAASAARSAGPSTKKH